VDVPEVMRLCLSPSVSTSIVSTIFGPGSPTTKHDRTEATTTTAAAAVATMTTTTTMTMRKTTTTTTVTTTTTGATTMLLYYCPRDHACVADVERTFHALLNPLQPHAQLSNSHRFRPKRNANKAVHGM
jgi:hypothetical protein